MTDRPGQFRVRTIALVALAAIVVAFGFLYYNARNGDEKGTSRDDSPAAEAGMRKDASSGSEPR